MCYFRHVLRQEEIRRRREHGRSIRRGGPPDLEVCAAAGRRGAGLRVRRVVEERHGAAGMRPGKIPGWWWCLAVKPDPRVLFECEEWPVEINVGWHLANQHRIYGRYKWRVWYPAFVRGISWYQLWRERESRS